VDEGARRSQWIVEVISRVERTAVHRSLHRIVRPFGVIWPTPTRAPAYRLAADGEEKAGWRKPSACL